MWQLLVGMSLVKKSVGLPLPLLVYLDSGKPTRLPGAGSDVPMHPSMGFMCGHTVNRTVRGIHTHYAETAEEALALLPSEAEAAADEEM